MMTSESWGSSQQRRAVNNINGYSRLYRVANEAKPQNSISNANDVMRRVILLLESSHRYLECDNKHNSMSVFKDAYGTWGELYTN